MFYACLFCSACSGGVHMRKEYSARWSRLHRSEERRRCDTSESFFIMDPMLCCHSESVTPWRGGGGLPESDSDEDPEEQDSQDDS